MYMYFCSLLLNKTNHDIVVPLEGVSAILQSDRYTFHIQGDVVSSKKMSFWYWKI